MKATKHANGMDCPVPDWIPIDYPARRIIAHKGGSRVDHTDSGGIECCRSDIFFTLTSREDAVADIDDWERLLETCLVGIAEVHRAHGQLYVASDEACYGASGVHDAFYFEGGSLTEAIDRLTRGLMARPMIHPSQTTVSLYGTGFDRRDPAIHHPPTAAYRAATAEADQREQDESVSR